MFFGKGFVQWVLLTVCSTVGVCSAACPVGDLNGDCQVDLQDLALFAGQWLEMPDCSTLPCADLDGADGVNLADLAILSRNWGLKSYPILFNEYMSSNHSTIEDPDNPGEYPDWIELYNFGSKAVDVGGCWLSDDPAIAKKFPIPAGFPDKTTIPSGGFLLLWMDRDLKQGPTHFDFKLSATTSEFVGLSDPSGQPIDSLDTIALTADISYGRKLDGAAEWMIFGPSTQTSPTPGTSNGSVEDDDKVMISEIMYHPYNAAHPLAENILEEYFELYNSGIRPVRLGGWRVTRGVEFTFPEVTIQPKAYLAVAANVAIFQAKYPTVSNVVGGWVGHLSNSGETIEVVNTLGRVIDSVPYSDEGDWSSRLLGPVESFGGNWRGWEWSDLTDGQGHSLELRNPAMPNEYGKNWGASQAVGGTPGRANSDATDNIAPLILNVKHMPVIPRPADPVTVTARILDEQMTGLTVNLHYRKDTSTYQSNPANGTPTFDTTGYTVVSMFDDGAHGDDLANDGVYAAQIPAMPNKTIVEFFVEASDATALTRHYPGAAQIDGVAQQVTNLLYQVDQSFDPAAVWTAGKQPIYYLIMTEMERGRLDAIGNNSNIQGPNSQMNATFISIDGTGMELRYNLGVRNRGHGTRIMDPMQYHIHFPNDNRWKGVNGTELNTNYTAVYEIATAAFEMAGIAEPAIVPIQVRVNGQNLAPQAMDRTFGSYVLNESVDSDWVAKRFPNDPAGNAYKCMRIDGGGQANLAYLGTNPDSYRGPYTKQTNGSIDDWTDLFNLTYALSATTDSEYVAAVNRVIDVEQWMRFMAVNTLADNRENSIAMGTGDEYFMYCGVNNPRFVLIQHDLEAMFGVGDETGTPVMTGGLFRAAGVPAISRLIKHPQFAPRYYWHLKNLMDTVLSAEQFGRLVDQRLGSWISAGTIQTMKQHSADVNAYVLARIPLTISVTTAVNATTKYVHTTTNTVSLAGLANAIDTRRVTVNGQPAVWTAWTATWTISNVALLPGVNRVVIQAFDAADKEIDRSSVDVWYNTGSMTTKASGTLASDEVWTPQGGPYNITASLTIPAGRTLTIQPGTSVYLGSNINLEVANGGRILAEGTQYQQIRFASVPASGASWGGITIHGTAGSPETRMSYVFFEGNGGTCIHSDGGTLFLDNASFGATTHQYVSVDSSSFLISHCVFPKTTAEFEPLHGTGGIKSGGRGILRDCFFGGTSGYNDQFDFTGGNRDRNEQIFEVYNNVFMNASDDMLDIDGTDAWVEGNIFVHCHRNNSPDSSSAVSGGNDSGNTSEITILGNLFYDCDNAATAKQGNFFTMINNTIVHTTKTGGQDSDSGVVNVRDTTPDITTFARGFYLEGNVIVDAGQLVRNYDAAQTTVTFINNILPSAWNGPGSGNVVVDPALKHIPELSETNFTSCEQAQVMRDWFSLQPGSAAQGTGPNEQDMGGVIPFGASVSGIPVGVTWRTDATLFVGVNRSGFGIPTTGFPLGSGYIRYKWRLDSNDWSAELPIAEPIILSGLAEGPHHVEVIGINDAGRSQNGAALGTDAGVTVSPTWTVDTTYRRLIISEVLARNAGTLPVNGSFPNLIELYYDAPGTMPLGLGGMKITDGGTTANEYVFPAGTQILPGEYKVLLADRDLVTPGIHLGFFLNGEGDAVKLYNAVGELIDSVQFGFQIAGLSIGRLSPDGDWVLCKPTFGGPNMAQPVQGPSRMKINEWLANGQVRFSDDFVELYNPETVPVRFDGVSLTDNYYSEPTKFTLPTLSFINAQESLALWSKQGGNANNLNFHLQSENGTLVLLDPDRNFIDGILYADQTTDYSQGRTPDGSNALEFFKIPTPGQANPKGATTVYTTTTLIPENAAKKVLVPTTAVAEAWKGGAAFNDSAWNSGTYISGKAGGVGYENNPGDAINYTDLISYDIKSVRAGTVYIRVPFTLTADQVSSLTSLNLKMRYDDAFVAYVNGVSAVVTEHVPTTPAWNSYATGTHADSAAKQFVDYPITDTAVLASLKVGQNILAVHGMDATSSSDLIFSFILEMVTQHTEGENTMAPYEALVDGLRITEVMYAPAAGGVEYIELKNVGSQTLNLKGVRFMDGIAYEFGNRTLNPGQFVIVAADVAAFQALYGTSISVVGPYVGALKDRGETIVLALPDPYVAAIMRFTYQGNWYPSTNGGGHSLVIVNDQLPAEAWDHAEAWRASTQVGGSPGADDPQ